MQAEQPQQATQQQASPPAQDSVAPPLSHVIFRSPNCHEELEFLKYDECSDEKEEEEEEGEEDDVCTLERTMSTVEVTDNNNAKPNITDTCGNRRLVAHSPISKGSLVLLEHALTVPMNLMRTAIRHDEVAFDILYPRDTSKRWAEHVDKNSEEMNDLLAQKIACNAIGDPNQLLNMALGFSAINHAFPSNCAMRSVRVTQSPMEKDLALMFLYVVAKHDIEAGEEITVTYAAAAQEDHPFIRTPSAEEFEAEMEIEESVLQSTKLHFRAVDQYLERKRWVGVSCRHKLMTDGIFLAPNYLVMSDECIKRVPEDFRTYLVEVLVRDKIMNPALQGEEGKEGKEGDNQVVQKMIGEPGSQKRKHLEMESLFRWEWERTLQVFNEFVFRAED